MGGVYVEADGQLAERWCFAHVMGLTVERAAQLRVIHGTHPPDDCLVHLAAAQLLGEVEK